MVDIFYMLILFCDFLFRIMTLHSTPQILIMAILLSALITRSEGSLTHYCSRSILETRKEGSCGESIGEILSMLCEGRYSKGKKRSGKSQN